MITEYDERVNTSKYISEFEEVAQNALDHIREHFMEYKEKSTSLGYSNEFRGRTLVKVFDELISPHGFEVDARTIRHAHGIGNNKEWDVVDKNLEKVGDFSAVDNMFCGVILTVTVKGKRLDGFEICSGGFIRGD